MRFGSALLPCIDVYHLACNYVLYVCACRQPAVQSASLQHQMSGTVDTASQGPQEQRHSAEHKPSSVVKIALEAVLSDGSTSRFDVDQVCMHALR